MISSSTSYRAGRGGIAAFSMAKLTYLGRNVPNRKSRMRVKYSIDVPPLSCSNNHKRLVTSLPPRPNVFTSLLETSSQRIGCLLIEAMQCIAVNVMPHFWLVDVACSRFFCEPKNLISHLYLHTRHNYLFA